MSLLHLHFEGQITRDHTVSLRTLGRSLHHLQGAVNRAHLDVKYGEVWKNARLKGQDYAETELWSRPPRDGGFIIEFVENSPRIKKTLSRIVSAITPAVEASRQGALANASSLAEQSAIRDMQVKQGIIDPQSYENFLPSASQHPYGDRAINKEVDQLISVVRNSNAGQSTIELIVDTDKPHAFKFNRVASENFHAIVSRRHLGSPLVFSVRVTELDAINKTAKVINVVTERMIKLQYKSEVEFNVIKMYLGIALPMNFVGSPIYEGGAYDTKGGDVFFIRLV
ncbi:hypothetical protein IMW75_11155 [Pseudomonas gregormendelii]|uniref:Uncharacterized protein n=1 Tax=Pseudomonas gregormendelii TaxID=1628277 RepID=A0ABS3AHN1_9PSED|nr:hypothetical protein [Pseudomonas gregormendelii]MBN3965836.1 hypothetical protein [Pseudomonas gregormendelii]